MNITTICIGKTDEKAIELLLQKYENRLPSHINYQRIEIPDLKNRKNLSEIQQKEKEGELILGKIQSTDFVIILDEKGKQPTSKQLADLIQQYMNQAVRNLVFVIGGPYGFSEAVYSRGNQKMALSNMTFTHQMVRLFLTEQLYRGFTILQGKPYHHE